MTQPLDTLRIRARAEDPSTSTDVLRRDLHATCIDMDRLRAENAELRERAAEKEHANLAHRVAEQRFSDLYGYAHRLETAIREVVGGADVSVLKAAISNEPSPLVSPLAVERERAEKAELRAAGLAHTLRSLTDCGHRSICATGLEEGCTCGWADLRRRVSAALADDTSALDSLLAERDQRLAALQAKLTQLTECHCRAEWTSRGKHETHCLAHEAPESTAELERLLAEARQEGARERQEQIAQHFDARAQEGYAAASSGTVAEQKERLASADGYVTVAETIRALADAPEGK